VMATGKFNHVSFRCKDTEAVRRKLRAQGLPFREAPVPGFPLHQIFLHDPAGLMIELTFDIPEKPAAKHRPARAAASRRATGTRAHGKSRAAHGKKRVVTRMKTRGGTGRTRARA